MRKLFLILAFLLCSSQSYAIGSTSGFCELGNQTVTVQGLVSTTKVQKSYPQCTVAVYINGTATLATIYSDSAASPTPLANPFTANTNGTYTFFAVNGKYDIVRSAGTPSPGISPSVTTFGAPVFDPSVATGKVYDCAAPNYAGATMGAKLVSCFAAIQVTGIGGTADARGITGTQAINTNPYSGITVPIRLMLGASTITLSVSLSLPNVSGTIIDGLSNEATVINYTGTGTAIQKGDQTSAKPYFQMRNVKLTTSSGAVGINLTSLWLSTIENNYISGFPTAIYASRASTGTYWDWIQLNLIDSCSIGVYLDSAGSNGQTNMIWIQNNRIFDCTTNAIKAVGPEVLTIIVTGNDMESSGSIPRFIDWDGDKSMFMSNWFETQTPSDTAIYLTGNRNTLIGNTYAGSFTPPPYVLVDTQNEVWEPSRFYTSTDVEVAGYIGAGFAATGLSTPLYPLDIRGNGSGGIAINADPAGDSNNVIAVHAGSSVPGGRVACFDLYQYTQRDWGICKDPSGNLVFVDAVTGSTNVMTFTVGGGMQLGSPTGGDKGVGSLNVSGNIYRNNSAYNNPDYVFEKHYTGGVKVTAENEGAASYPGLRPLDQVEQETKSTFELSDRVKDARGIFDRTDVLLEKLEEAYIYIFQINSRLKALESAPK